MTSAQPRAGYYFVYAFGGIEGQPRQVYGWRVERETDRMTDIEGMPLAMPGVSPTTPAQYADNYQHGSDIVVLVGLQVWQYAASPISGKLELMRQVGTSIEYQRVFATQDPAQYILYKHGSFAPTPTPPSWALYDTESGVLSEFPDLEIPPFALSRNSVGMTWKHPTLPILYRSGGYSGPTPSEVIWVRRYGYDTLGSTPTLQEEWSFYGPSYDAANGIAPYTVTPSGSAVVVALAGGMWLVHRLNPDGSFASHTIHTSAGDIPLPNGGGYVPPPSLPISTAALLGNDAVVIPRTNPAGSSFTLTNHSIGASGVPNIAASIIGEIAGSTDVAFSYPGEGEATRLRSGLVPLLDSSRIIASVGRNLFQYIGPPFFAFERDVSLSVLKPSNQGGGALALSLRANRVITSGAVAGETTDYLSALAVFEPKQGVGG